MLPHLVSSSSSCIGNLGVVVADSVLRFPQHTETRKTRIGSKGKKDVFVLSI